MRRILISFLLSFFGSLQIQAQSLQNTPLDDLISPDEIADELGIPHVESPDEVLRIDEVDSFEGVNLFREYAIVLIINKKAVGPGAQTMRVYEHGYLVAEWLTSTGRERHEEAKSGRRYFSATPVGYFYPQTIKRNHWSHTWKANMEFSIFFNGGVAVHATTPDHYPELGSRASGGCVRLHRDNAEYIYHRILEEGKGLVPVINRNGQVKRDRVGQPVYATKWKTLIVVVNE